MDASQQPSTVSAAAVAQVMSAMLEKLDDIDEKVDNLVGEQIGAILRELQEINGSVRGHSRTLAGLAAWKTGHCDCQAQGIR